MHQAGRAGLGQAWLEALIWLFDFVAFWGYAVFPLTFFYPDEKLYKAYLGDVYPGACVRGRLAGGFTQRAHSAPSSFFRRTRPVLSYHHPTPHPPKQNTGHSRVLYHGGLLGDIMWTVQPLAMLGSAAIRAYLEETLASGAPAFEIRRPLPAVARKRSKSSSRSSAPAPAAPAKASSAEGGSAVTRRTSAAAATTEATAPETATAAVAARSPGRKAYAATAAAAASSLASPASLTSPSTPATVDSKKKKGSGVWSPSFMGRTTRSSQRKKAD